MKLVITLSPSHGVTSASLGINSNMCSGYFWYCFWNSRKSGSENIDDGGMVGKGVLRHMGHTQGASGILAWYWRWSFFPGRGVVRCEWWKSRMASGALVRLDSVIHSFSSTGYPFQDTKYSILFRRSLDANISSISCSSTLLMMSGGGGGVVFCDGNIPFVYGWSKHSLKTLWMPLHFKSSFNLYAVFPTFSTTLKGPYRFLSNFFDGRSEWMFVPSSSTRSPGWYSVLVQLFLS